MTTGDALPESIKPILDEVDTEAIQSALITWYQTNHRAFPWRETTDPYQILVSEVMSQQTQLERVVEAWENFIDRWPTVEALAGADRSEVVAFWSDHRLGYNNRARYLHEAATQVRDEYDGAFPETPAELENLMGVGPYTANAVASFAFNNGNAVVDTNVKRVLYRLLAGVRETDTRENNPPYDELANAVMPADESRIWNNAIMELGGTVCESTPKCDEQNCPLRTHCHAYETGDFTAPDVPTQPAFDGSRRQFRGRIVRALGEHDELELDVLGPKIRVDYTPDGTHGREWLRGILSDLAEDEIVELKDSVARLRD